MRIPSPIPGVLGWPDRLDASAVEDLARGWHSREEDFWEGDLSDRIYAYPEYVLQEIPLAQIDLHEWAVCGELVDAYAARLAAGEEMPPVLWDPDRNSMIDGIHRANAARQAGSATLLAYVGRR